MTRLLAGDIGGTKTALALYEGEPGHWTEVRDARYPSAEHDALEPIVEHFLQGTSLDAAGFGVAGPVVRGRCETTNIPWVIEQAALRSACGTDRVGLANDLQAAALAVAEVGEDRRCVLQAGEPDPEAPSLLIGVGTGLGQALLVPTAQGSIALPTEGGHADFAPRNELEMALLRSVLKRHDRVSTERIVSGSGLWAIYRFVEADGLATPAADTARALEAADDKSAVVGQRGADGVCPACVRSLELFVDLLGAECGNMALKTLPRAGLVLMGGVALKLKSWLQRPEFLAAFNDKGRMQPVTKSIPVAILLESELGLLGARAVAAAQL